VICRVLLYKSQARNTDGVPNDMPKKIKVTSPTIIPNAQVKLLPTPETPFYYVNYISVSHLAYDFTMSVAKLPSIITPDQVAVVQSGQPLVMEPTLQLVIPPTLIKGLIFALTEQVRKYEEQFKITIHDFNKGQNGQQ
jgi:hypothetical protein